MNEIDGKRFHSMLSFTTIGHLAVLEKIIMDEFLKGNFKIKNAVLEKTDEQKAKGSDKIKEQLKKAALNSIGGSMVYVERTDLVWNGDEDADE